jgi:hypothetical protein
MSVSSDFRVKNGLVVGASSLGSITGGVGTFNTSLSTTSLSSVSGNFTGVGGLRVPVGTTAQRPPAADGFIRLNTSLSQFEGYSSSTWRGLGGVIDVDQDTKILAELTAGGDEDSLFFYTGGTERMRLTSAGVLSAASDVTLAGDLTVQGNDIKSSGGTAITLSTTDVSIAGDLTVTGNDVKDSGANTVLTFDGSGNVSLPGNLTVNGTHTTLNTSVTSTTTATENNFVITSTDTGAAASPDLKLWRNSASPADDDTIGNVIFTGNDSGGTATDYGHILTQITDVTNATEDSRMTFKTMAAGTLADRLTINSGSVGIGTTNPNNTLTVAGTLSASGQITGNITGDLTGNADTATALETARTIGGVSFDGTANIVPTTIVVADTTNTKNYLGMFESATGNLLPKTDANIYYNASTSRLTIEGSLSASGIIYADAFNSRTGGSTIDFNDPIDLAGTLTITDDIVHSGDTDTKLSFTTDLITLYGANTNLLRIDGTNNVVGIGTVSTASPSIPTVVEFNNDTTAYKSASATITTGASAALLSIPTASYRSGKIVLQSVAASGGHMDVTELLYIHNGTTVYTTEYATVRVGSAIGTYTGVINGSNVEIRAANGVGVTAEFVGSITMLSV